MWRRLSFWLSLMLTGMTLLSGCAIQGDVPDRPGTPPINGATGQGERGVYRLDVGDSPRGAPGSDPGAVYRLDVGDRVRVIVFGEPDLSSPENGFEVQAAGYISMPLIGPIRAKGLTVEELERQIEEKLKAGYLKNPKVSVEVLNYRPFYILGEVNQPGSYHYVNGLTVKQAAAIAGGFTYRADQDDIYIERQGKKIKADLNTPVLPGDTIWVPERFF